MSFRDNGYDDLDQIVSMTHLQELPEASRSFQNTFNKTEQAKKEMDYKWKNEKGRKVGCNFKALSLFMNLGVNLLMTLLIQSQMVFPR